MKRHPTTQRITWFLDLDNTGQLNLDPPYQRRSVWTLKDRQYFLDTIFNNYPCPTIFIHAETDDDGRTTYNVVDGKQRLQTILMFSQNKISIAKDFGHNDYNSKEFQELTKEQKRQFWDYMLVVDTVDSSKPDQINQMFDRLNRNQKSLNDQELRHAKFNGWFLTEAEKESEEPFWEKIKVSTTTKSKRMKDVQFISELLMVIIEKSVEGFDQNHIDAIYTEYNDVSNSDLDINRYLNEKKRIKKYVDKMEDNNTITKWSTTANNFYVLWAVIALKDIPDNPNEFAKKYEEFMQKVESMTEETDPDKLSGQDEFAFKYYKNSRGASTDRKQRMARIEALDKALLKKS